MISEPKKPCINQQADSSDSQTAKENLSWLTQIFANVDFGYGGAYTAEEHGLSLAHLEAI